MRRWQENADLREGSVLAGVRALAGAPQTKEPLREDPVAAPQERAPTEIGGASRAGALSLLEDAASEGPQHLKI